MAFPQDNLNFNLPPEFANNPNIRVGPATRPMRKVSGWGQEFSVPVGDNPAAIVMADRGIEGGTPTPLSRELAPGGTSNAPMPAEETFTPSLEANPTWEPHFAPKNPGGDSGDWGPVGGVGIGVGWGGGGGGGGDINLPPSRDVQLPGPTTGPPIDTVKDTSPPEGGTDWGRIASTVKAGANAARSSGGGAREYEGAAPRFDAPGVGMGMQPMLNPTAPTQMGPAAAAGAGAANDRSSRLRGLLKTLIGM